MNIIKFPFLPFNVQKKPELVGFPPRRDSGFKFRGSKVHGSGCKGSKVHGSGFKGSINSYNPITLNGER
jgi:hypothetical protein